jgi:hypothetical protein
LILIPYLNDVRFNNCVSHFYIFTKTKKCGNPGVSQL